MTLSGKTARVKITAAAATSSTGEACTRSTGTTGAGWVAVNSTAKRHFNRNNSTAFTLYLDSTAVSSTAWKLNPVLGRFEWKTGDPSTGVYTADIEYVTASYLGETQAWTVDSNLNMLDVTAFSTSGTDTQWRTFKPGLSQATVGLSRTKTSSTEEAFFDRLAAQQDVIVELWGDNTRWEAYAHINQDSFVDPIDGFPTETPSLTVDGQLYHSTI